MTKKVTINEDDLKKVILILRLSYPYLRYTEMDNRLRNLWRVRDGNLVEDSTKGRLNLKK